MTPTQHNLNAILVGTGEFRFCLGATSAADAKLKGFRDFDNIVAFTPETQNESTEHEGSYRGKKVVDKKFSTKIALEYVLTQDAWTRNNLKLLFMGDDGVAHTQPILTAAQIDTLAFTSNIKSVVGRWYDLYNSSARVRALTTLHLSIAAAQACVADATGDTITLSAHGFNNGDQVILQGTAAPAGTTLNTAYYVVNSATDTFKLALTSGGASIDLTSTGTAVTVRKVLIKGTDYEEDLTLGSVRFLAEHAATVYAIVTASAIVVGDDNYFHGIEPLSNPTIEGYGRLIVYDGNDKNVVVLDHVDFSCTIAAEKGNAVDGKKPSEFSIRVTVGDDVGNMLVRQGNEDE